MRGAICFVLLYKGMSSTWSLDTSSTSCFAAYAADRHGQIDPEDKDGIQPIFSPIIRLTM